MKVDRKRMEEIMDIIYEDPKVKLKHVQDIQWAHRSSWNKLYCPEIRASMQPLTEGAV